MSNEIQIDKDYLNIDKDIKRLVDWANPPSVRDLKGDLSEALPNHDIHVSKINEWLEALKGTLKAKTMEGRSKVQPKLIRKQNEWRYAALEEPFLSTDDLFKVNPVTHLDVDSARQNELILNKQFRVDIPKVSFINKFIRKAVNTGTVITKVSWETETGIVREEVPVFTETPEELYKVLVGLVQSGEIAEDEAMMLLESGEPMQIGTEVKEVEKEIINRPVVEVRDSRRVIVDPSCEGDANKAQFIIDKVLIDLSTLKKDGRYKNLEYLEKRESDYEDAEYYEDQDYHNFKFQDKPRQKLVMYEYWGYWDIDGKGTVKPIVAAWVGNTMIRLEENPYPDKKLPFVITEYLPQEEESVHGDADASLLMDNQAIIGAVTRSMIDLIARTATGQRGIRKDLLDPINADKFKKGIDFDFNPVSSIDDALYTSKVPEIPNSALDMINLQNNEAEALTGVKAFTGGISGDALGSMLDLDTIIPLYDGSLKPLREIKVGDELIGKDGKGTKVVTLFGIDYPDKAYNITFSNGVTITAGIEHKWAVKVDGAERKYRDFTTQDTGFLVKYFNKGKKLYIPRIERVDMQGEYPDVDPYCIGFWLGDGNSYRSSITAADEEVVKYFSQFYHLRDETYNSNYGKAKAYAIEAKESTRERNTKGQFKPDKNSFEYWLRTLGLMKSYGGEKHIPKQYFSAPYKVKLELLRGLMDSDGYAHSGAFNIFTQTKGRLLQDVIKLLKSMGITPTISKYRTAEELNKYKETSQTGLQITSKKDLIELGFTCNDNPFKISRKANRYRKPKQNSTYRIISIVEVTKPLMRCLQVDSPDHLFAATEDMILTHNSVGGIRSALDATAKRELSILRRLAAGIKEIGRKIIAMNSVWLSDEEIIRITDDEFVAIPRSDLAGNFDLVVDISTAEVDNQKAEELAFMLQTTGNTMDLGILKLILSKIARLRKLPDLAKAIEEFEPQPDPMQQRIAELQIELLEVQITNEAAKAEKNVSDSELKLARAQNELAKAGKTISERDQIDLDYVEQATGLKQERDLEQEMFKKSMLDGRHKETKPKLTRI